MDPNIEDILLLAERVMLHVRHDIPPEIEVMDSLQKMIDQYRDDHGIPPPISQANLGKA